MKILDEVILPNGQIGTVLRIHEYGYTAYEDKTGKPVSVIIDSPIKPVFKHKCYSSAHESDICKWLDNHPDTEIVSICSSSMSGFHIFYNEETFESITNRLGKIKNI